MTPVAKAHAEQEPSCFGMYLSTYTCTTCILQKKCKALLVSDGFDIVAAMVEQLIEQLPENMSYTDTDRASELMMQVMTPNIKKNSSDDVMDLLNQLQNTPNDMFGKI